MDQNEDKKILWGKGKLDGKGNISKRTKDNEVETMNALEAYMKSIMIATTAAAGARYQGVRKEEERRTNECLFFRLLEWF